MTGLIRKATLLAACGLMIAAAVSAGVPDKNSSTFPSYVRLVGAASGVPDTTDGRFLVIVRDVGGNPLGGVFVKADFSACTADTKIASNQLNVNYTTDCTGHTVGAYTDITGSVYLTLLGNSFGAAVNHLGCATLYAGAVSFGGITANEFDLDGGGGQNTNDISIGLGDLAIHPVPAFGRSDFDQNGTLSANDTSIALGVLAGHRIGTPTPAVCP